MNAKMHDELLYRIDERLGELKRSYEIDIPKIIEHLSNLNGCVGKNTIWRKVIIAVGSSALLMVFSWLCYLTFGG